MCALERNVVGYVHVEVETGETMNRKLFTVIQELVTFKQKWVVKIQFGGKVSVDGTCGYSIYSIVCCC